MGPILTCARLSVVLGAALPTSRLPIITERINQTIHISTVVHACPSISIPTQDHSAPTVPMKPPQPSVKLSEPFLHSCPHAFCCEKTGHCRGSNSSRLVNRDAYYKNTSRLPTATCLPHRVSEEALRQVTIRPGTQHCYKNLPQQMNANTRRTAKKLMADF